MRNWLVKKLGGFTKQEMRAKDNKIKDLYCEMNGLKLKLADTKLLLSTCQWLKMNVKIDLETANQLWTLPDGKVVEVRKQDIV